MKFSALVLKRNKKLSWEEVRVKSTLGFVPIRVLSAGVCNSDIARSFGNGAYHYPLVMGHEIIGVLASGKRVAVYPLIHCTMCDQCKLGAFHRCHDYDYLGSRRDGGFAQVVLTPPKNLVTIPQKLDVALAALTEPAAVIVHAAQSLRIPKHTSILVIGDGTMGLLLARWLRADGHKHVSVLGRHEHKLAIVERLGAKPFQRVSGVFDIVFELAGSNEAYLQAIKSASPGGKIVLIGNCKGDVTIPKETFSSILRKEVHIQGSWNSLPRDFRTASTFLASQPILRDLVTHTYPMHEGAQAFTALASRREKDHIKTVLLT